MLAALTQFSISGRHHMLSYDTARLKFWLNAQAYCRPEKVVKGPQAENSKLLNVLNKAGFVTNLKFQETVAF